jgi:CheY-like chemotaxis protein
MADDDSDDCLFVESAFEDQDLAARVLFVQDGIELMQYLKHGGRFSDPLRAPRPDLILLDLNMPRKDGREALKEIKTDPEIEDIPVVILTTSADERDIDYSRKAGASSFLTKPVLFEEWVEMLKCLTTTFLDYPDSAETEMVCEPT